MSLRIRRGTDAQRQTITFDQGEIVFTTDTKKVYVGDGITTGGNNILATSAGVGVSFNATTQAFDFNTNSLGLTTSVVTEGTNKYFTTQRAQDAAASLFTAAGSPTSTGTITGTIASGTITVSVAPSPALAPGERFVVAGSGGNGLLVTTYYVVSVTSNSIVLASSQALAIAGTAITSLTTGSITGTTYTAGGTDTGITFSYDSVNHVMTVNSSGVTSVVSDTSPSLGGNLTLAGYNIVGTVSGNSITINGTTGAVTAASFTGPHTGTTTGILNGNVISATSTTIIDNTAQTLSLRPTVGLFANLYAISSSGNLPYILINASNGTYTAPTASIANDVMGGIQWTGYNGTSYNLSSVINTIADGAVVNGNVPGKLQLGVQNSTGTGIQPMTFNSLGILSVPSMTAGLNIRQVNAITIATTSTYSLSSTKSVNLLLVTAGSLTATLNMPTSPVDGQECKFSVSGNAVTLAVGTGTTAPTFSGAASVGNVFTYVYQATTTTWYRL
jgi:hypothetical protein